MAAATATGRKLNRVSSDIRVVVWSSVVFANTGDTLTVPGIKSITDISYTPTTNAAFGFTIGTGASSNVVTLTSAAGLTGLMMVRGL